MFGSSGNADNLKSIRLGIAGQAASQGDALDAAEREHGARSNDQAVFSARCSGGNAWGEC